MNENQILDYLDMLDQMDEEDRKKAPAGLPQDPASVRARKNEARQNAARASVEAEEILRPRTGEEKREAFFAGFLNNLSLGTGDEFAGVIGAMKDPMDLVGGYNKGRGDYLAELEAATEAAPAYVGAGDAAGTFAGALVPGANALKKGSALGAVGSGMLTGGAMGAVGGAASAEENRLEAGLRGGLIGTGVGAIGGAGAAKLAQVANRARGPQAGASAPAPGPGVSRGREVVERAQRAAWQATPARLRNVGDALRGIRTPDEVGATVDTGQPPPVPMDLDELESLSSARGMRPSDLQPAGADLGPLELDLSRVPARGGPGSPQAEMGMPAFEPMQVGNPAESMMWGGRSGLELARTHVPKMADNPIAAPGFKPQMRGRFDAEGGLLGIDDLEAASQVVPEYNPNRPGLLPEMRKEAAVVPQRPNLGPVDPSGDILSADQLMKLENIEPVVQRGRISPLVSAENKALDEAIAAMGPGPRTSVEGTPAGFKKGRPAAQPQEPPPAAEDTQVGIDPEEVMERHEGLDLPARSAEDTKAGRTPKRQSIEAPADKGPGEPTGVHGPSSAKAEMEKLMRARAELDRITDVDPNELRRSRQSIAIRRKQLGPRLLQEEGPDGAVRWAMTQNPKTVKELAALVGMPVSRVRGVARDAGIDLSNMAAKTPGKLPKKGGPGGGRGAVVRDPKKAE